MAPALRTLRPVFALLTVSVVSAAAVGSLSASPARAVDRTEAKPASSARSYGFRLETHTDFAAATQASPSVARKNAIVTVRGTLLLANWNQNGYQRFTRQPVEVQFAAAGSRRWFTVASTSTDASGTATARIRAAGATARSGSYRMYYAGNGTTAAATSSPVRVDYR